MMQVKRDRRNMELDNLKLLMFSFKKISGYQFEDLKQKFRTEKDLIQ